MTDEPTNGTAIAPLAGDELKELTLSVPDNHCQAFHSHNGAPCEKIADSEWNGLRVCKKHNPDLTPNAHPRFTPLSQDERINILETATFARILKIVKVGRRIRCQDGTYIVNEPTSSDMALALALIDRLRSLNSAPGGLNENEIITIAREVRRVERGYSANRTSILRNKGTAITGP